MMNDTPAVVSFNVDIKPLFRASDRDAMSRAFDLWSRDDVAAHAAQITTRLKDGSMPCDGAWTATQVMLFEAWIDDGLQP
jgi:hypothetical protein